MQATLTSRQQLTETIASFSFKPATDFGFTAGQYINLTLNSNERWFTISSSPHHSDITITTRISKSAFKRSLHALHIGDEVSISEPMGAFVLPKLLQTPLIFVAGGIGITPFHSMLQWLTHAQERRPIHMIYGVKTEDDIIFQDTFNDARQHVTLVVDEPSNAWGGLRGPLTAEMITGLETLTDDTLVYISGPEPYVQNMQQQLKIAGVPARQLVTDEFQGYSQL